MMIDSSNTLQRRLPTSDKKAPVNSTITVVVTVGYGLGLLFFIIRTTVRVKKPTKLGAQDYFLIFGMVTFTAYYGCLMAALASGLGSIWDPQVNTPNITGPLSLCLNQLYVWTSVWIKCSIISLLKSFRREVTAWQWTLECLRVVIFLAAISAIFVQFFQCHPLRASWDFSLPRSACAGFSIYRYFLVSISSIFIWSDVVLSVAPIYIIRNIRCPLREKVSIIILMGLGIVCAAAIIPKIINVRKYGRSGDDIVTVGYICMWSAVEISIGMIVACAPIMKTLFEATLRKVGLLSSTSTVSADPKNMRFNTHPREGSSIAETLQTNSDSTVGKGQKQWSIESV